MNRLLAALYLALTISSSLVASTGHAQMALPAARPPDGATLFKQQCGTCHTTDASEPARQGPPLDKVLGQPAGRHVGFRYSTAMSHADFIWNETRLDAWLSNPADVVPGATMAYRQSKPETRAAIITYLKGLH